jgi:hypothetical protein
VIVLAIAGRATVEAATDVGQALAHLDGHLRHGPAADLSARHLRQSFERRQLWIMIAAILCRLTSVVILVQSSRVLDGRGSARFRVLADGQ